MQTLRDEDLKDAGLFVDRSENSLYEISDEEFDRLFSIRDGKAKSINFDPEQESPKSDFKTGLGGGGSNCWVVHGDHTTSGKPILACDPHLVRNAMSMWYTIRLGWNDPTTGERTGITGGSLVGSPAFTFGRTPYVSWGTTAVNPDVIDLYVETIKDE
jgi:acyl-homoserine lactone acylase PvdQ